MVQAMSPEYQQAQFIETRSPRGQFRAHSVTPSLVAEPFLTMKSQMKAENIIVDSGQKAPEPPISVEVPRVSKNAVPCRGGVQPAARSRRPCTEQGLEGGRLPQRAKEPAARVQSYPVGLSLRGFEHKRFIWKTHRG